MADTAAASAPIRTSVLTRRDIVARGIVVILADHPHQISVVPMASLTDSRISADVVVYDLALLHHLGRDHLSALVQAAGRRVVGLAPAVASPLRGIADELGVAGCVTLDVSSDELLGVVRRVAAGEMLTGKGLKTPLSRREAQVMLLVCQGLTNQEVSERLFLSLNTVKSHLRAAYRKMCVTNRPQAMLWCAEHDLV
jgi:DNA-binding NarL/FixJ family response regulator